MCIRDRNPVAGIVGGIGNDLLSEYNTFKLGHLLNGLASGFNLERRKEAVPVTPASVYDVASLTKTTATLLAVMKLYDKGRLSPVSYTHLQSSLPRIFRGKE